MFHKENSIVSDNFIAIMGKWLPNDKNYLIISVYAPQELLEKKMLWQYLVHVISSWNGDVFIMGDFNKVRTEAERFSSTFNARGAATFNSFISTGGLVEVPSDKKEKAHVLKNSLKKKLADIDSVLDKGEETSDVLEDRLDTMNSLTKLEEMESFELAQKAKIKWSIEGDENSKYFHGIINKKRNNLAIRGIIVDGVWIEDPSVVKTEFLSHFRNRFDSPCTDLLTLDMEFPNVLSYEQAQDLERVFSKDEIKQAVWDCGLDKSPGPDGFTFGFYCKFWSLLEDDVIDAVCYF
ncbi:RNA-directed DNA polymerase, eukaryota [Tanacetum coccineum]